MCLMSYLNKEDQAIADWISKDPAQVLRQKAPNINVPLTKEYEKVAEKLIAYLKWSRKPALKKENEDHKVAVGIAAPQIGVSANLYYVNVTYFDDYAEQDVTVEHLMANSKIKAYSSQMTYLEGGEGCLSVERHHNGIVPRAYKIVVSGYDYLQQKFVTLRLRGYAAIVFQHEIKHTEGKLFYDLINEKHNWYVEPSWIKI